MRRGGAEMRALVVSCGTEHDDADDRDTIGGHARLSVQESGDGRQAGRIPWRHPDVALAHRTGRYNWRLVTTSASSLKLRLSQRSGDIVKSEIRNMSVEGERVRGITLSQGVCDTPVPPQIASAVDEGVRL